MFTRKEICLDGGAAGMSFGGGGVKVKKGEPGKLRGDVSPGASERSRFDVYTKMEDCGWVGGSYEL